VTRIIAGVAGSLALDVPAQGTRPTSDRVRESLFAALESMGALHGAAVLDLYAGSGALGLEALSRGASRADFVESAPRAARVIDANLRKVTKAMGAGPGTSLVHRTTADAYLGAASGPFDLVFVDPPYELTDDALGHTLTLLVPALAGDALVVIERAARSPQPRLPHGLEPVRHRRYGDTALWWSARAAEHEPTD
jgi:16S rRNA (guanine966-N2)-methyltransferase